MKVNDSGMPAEDYWNSLFDIDSIIAWLEIENIQKPFIEIGCGYGTFTVPIAKLAKAKIISYDIEPGMINTTKNNLIKNGLSNFELINRDVLENGINQLPDSCGVVLLFNILHFKERIDLLLEAKRVIKEDGVISIIHWRKDIQTPRGPSIEIRPSPNDIIEEAQNIGLHLLENVAILEPYHWGIKLTKRI